jgi:cobalt/nickel transport system permease protein
MPHRFLDRYSRLDSPIHRLPTALKVILALTVVIAALLIPRSRALPSLSIISGALILIAALTRIPPLFLFRRLIFLEPFVLGVAILALFQPNGLHVFLYLLLRSTLCLFTMILLANTTPFADLLRLLHSAKVPGLLITTLALMYRYLFVLVDETERMKRARQSRTFTKRRWSTWRTLATVLSPLFVRASERAERIYLAMCARGFK